MYELVQVSEYDYYIQEPTSWCDLQIVCLVYL